AGTQPGVSSKLREALGNEQQEELKLRMKLNSTYIRQGAGGMVWMAEQPVTQGLDELRDGIKQAQSALRSDNPQQQPGASNDDLQKALARVEQLRQQMQQLAQSGQQRRDGQNALGPQDAESQRLSRMAEQSGGQPGQQSGQQQGQQGGQQAGQRAPGGPRGGGGPAIGTYGGDRDPEQAYREALQELTQLRGSIGTSPEFTRGVNDLLQTIRQYDPSRIGDPNLLRDRLSRAVLPGLEDLELELRRQAGGDQSSQVRSGGADPIPPGYADAVAEYFRKLSKSK
ncbi:MAG: hypothetical protein ACREH9_00925, partial [Pseudomonadota bacterium]